MKKESEWESLEQRRKVNRVSLLHQALSGRHAIPTRTILPPVLLSLRHIQFIQIATNRNCLKYSFISITVIDLNAIPLHIKEVEDKDKFRAAVANITTSMQPAEKGLNLPSRFTPFRGVE